MNDTEPMPEPVDTRSSAPRASPLEDLTELYTDDVPPDCGQLGLVYPGDNVAYYVLFVFAVACVMTHFLEAASASIRAYVFCDGDGCALCRAGLKADERLLLPVYDPIACAIAVLPMTLNRRPRALLPQILPLLTRLKAGEPPILIAVRKVSRDRFSVVGKPTNGKVDDGAKGISEFVGRPDRREVDPASVYPTYSDEELADISEVQDRLELAG